MILCSNPSGCTILHPEKSPLFWRGRRGRGWRSPWMMVQHYFFGILPYYMSQKTHLLQHIWSQHSPFIFVGIAYLKGNTTKPNQGTPINLVRIYFYFDLCPWLFKGYYRTYLFSFLSVSGKQRHFMKAIFI